MKGDGVMTPENLSRETDSAVEQLLLKANGRKKTVQDVFEVVVAMNHDRRSDTLRLLKEIQCNREALERHLLDKLHWTADEFAEFVAGRDSIDALSVQSVEKVEDDLREELEGIKENCIRMHARAPRRKNDPETEDWGNSYGSEQAKQVWLMWLLGTGLGRVLVYVAGGVSMLVIGRVFGG